ncbi:MAG: DUF2189 domain-containing protein [Zoogloea sp.]|nr:DUF2189 domain-containing protein [Zoogloea sp.]
MAQHETPADGPGAEAVPPFPGIRVIGLGAPFRWIRRGFADFRACARSSLFYGFGLPGVLLPTLTVWRRNMGNIALFAGVLTVVFLIWARASMVIFAMFYTQEMPSLDGFLSQVLSLENIDFLMVYLAVGAGFALFVFAVSVVSIPLMLDRNQDAITSMLASLRALMLNPLPLLVWAVLIVTLTLIGFLSFHIGLVVMMPVVGHATWHAYRELVEPLP